MLFEVIVLKSVVKVSYIGNMTFEYERGDLLDYELIDKVMEKMVLETDFLGSISEYQFEIIRTSE